MARSPGRPGTRASAGSLRAVGTLEKTRSVSASGDLAAQQWAMRAIHAPEANKISRAVTVGVLDSGIEATHPALSAAVSASASAGCVTGAPYRSPAAWAPTASDHGTHVAGTISG